MGKNPAFQFYPNDYVKDLGDQPHAIGGAWMLILCSLFWDGGKQTKSLIEWAKILRENKKKTSKILSFLDQKKIADIQFLDNQNITIISRRMVRDYEISKIRQSVGKLGGNPLLNKMHKNLVKQTDNQKITPSSSSSTSYPNITPHTPRKRGDEYEPDFLTFWNAYPKKAKKPNAYREWKKLGSRRPDIAVLTACIQKQATWRPWIEGYIPDPERWLKNERWLDEPPPDGGGNGDRPTGRRISMGTDRLPAGVIQKVYAGDGPRPDVSPETVRKNLERIKALTGGVGKGGADTSTRREERADSETTSKDCGGSHS